MKTKVFTLKVIINSEVQAAEHVRKKGFRGSPVQRALQRRGWGRRLLPFNCSQ